DLLVGDLVKNRLKEIYPNKIIIHKDIGFELRGANPLAYDVEYGFGLGFGAVKFFLQNRSGLVVRGWQNFEIIDFSAIVDSNGICRARKVDIQSELFALAKSAGL
ncbi:MAG: hypothetical protein NZO16_07360, partial [Deltaproteobacteria bacterium]|nr:hypothetical protein [Deltaproteobacteria bacterium]